MIAVQESMSGRGNLPDNVRAGGQPAVEHRQAGVANEIGETHFWRFVGLNGKELIRNGYQMRMECGEAARGSRRDCCRCPKKTQHRVDRARLGNFLTPRYPARARPLHWEYVA